MRQGSTACTVQRSLMWSSSSAGTGPIPILRMIPSGTCRHSCFLVLALPSRCGFIEQLVQQEEQGVVRQLAAREEAALQAEQAELRLQVTQLQSTLQDAQQGALQAQEETSTALQTAYDEVKG